MLNHLDLGLMKLVANDIFSEIGWLKKGQHLFEVVILDPPFFSVTEKGKVDLVSESTRMLNKVRPLVQDSGYLIAINNALFLSGQEYMKFFADDIGLRKVQNVKNVFVDFHDSVFPIDDHHSILNLTEEQILCHGHQIQQLIVRRPQDQHNVRKQEPKGGGVHSLNRIDSKSI